MEPKLTNYRAPLSITDKINKFIKIIKDVED